MLLDRCEDQAAAMPRRPSSKREEVANLQDGTV